LKFKKLSNVYVSKNPYIWYGAGGRGGGVRLCVDIQNYEGLPCGIMIKIFYSPTSEEIAENLAHT
jgi:hypothetical protein